MPDFAMSLFVIAAAIVYFNYKPTLHLTVYNGRPFKGIPVSHNIIDSHGRVISLMSMDYRLILNDVDNNQCFDSIPTWCDRMIELSGLPVYLMTDTHYSSPLIQEVNECQEKMFLMSGMQYS